MIDHHYVIFVQGRLPKRAHTVELYVAMPRKNIAMTEEFDEALKFSTARDAYGFAGAHGLENCKVGLRCKDPVR
jgi:hypothetical protein